jgi:cytochrome c oxidase subunit 1
MTSVAQPLPAAAPRRRNYLSVDYGVLSWLLTTDHKRIAILYLVSVSVMFVLGGLFAVGIRLELATPPGDLFESDTYNKLFTLHGIVMVFFFLIPSIPAVLGNFLIPLMIGARDLAFPRLNLASWYIYVIGALFTLWAILNGGVDTGWTFYTPYSTAFSNTHVLAAGLGVFITGFSSILTGLNFIVTIHKMRAPGLTWLRLPLFVWAHYATSLIMILGTPVIAVTILLVAVERTLRLGIFDPSLGGDPVLFQHLFWFYSHPAVYIMILPAMGVISELVTCFSRKRVFGYEVIALSSLAIALIGFLVWGHHMFLSGQSTYAGMVFSFLSFMVAIPSAIKVFNWTATMYRGSVSLQTPMLYAMGFIGLFTIGGLTGLFVASMGIDVHVHDTYFVVAHFHYIMVGGAIMGYLGGLHFWWPKISGRLYPEWWARIGAVTVFLGFNLTFFPQFILGYLGMPRRYHAYAPEFQVLNVMSSAGATILGAGYLIPLLYLVWSMRYGARAPANPWGAHGLEWETESPPLTENFPAQPVVTREAYDYERKGEVLVV